MLDTSGRIVVLERDFIAAGFTLSGQFLTRGSLLVWICEDEDRLDRYFCDGKRIKTKEDLKSLVESDG